MLYLQQLHQEFRYVHEPLAARDEAIPVLGHEELVATLRERLVHSRGGTFLVSGFRGVGKSTLVLQALAATAEHYERAGKHALLSVHLNIARKMEGDQLLFAVVRRIFETLDDRGLLKRLPPDVQEALLLAYTRTSLSFKQTHSEGNEHGGTMGFGLQKGPLAAVTPTLSLTGKRTSARATEAAFLAYSETDVEHDLIRIIQLLGGVQGHPAPRRRRRLRRRVRDRLLVHPVIVLDEVDKLTDSSEDALRHLETLLGTLKNVLTARGAHFILVAGPDLHDQAIRDADRGNGVYESVFSWRMYVPCLWEAPERLLQGLLDARRSELRRTPEPPPLPGIQPPSVTWHGYPSPDAPDAEPAGLGTLTDYLRFKARGVPRRLLQELNALVVWGGSGRPMLQVPEEDWGRIQFYSHLEEVVSAAVAVDTADGPAPLPIDEDRWRLSGYHVVDWALRSRGRMFTAREITGDGQVDPLLRMDPPTVTRLLRHLVRNGVLEVASEGDRADATAYGNPADSRVTYYRLTDAYARRLAGFARHNENERVDLGLPAPQLAGPWDTATTVRPVPQGTNTTDGVPAAVVPERPLPVTRLGDRYEALEAIGSGGMGVVYRGRDLQTGDTVAIKLLRRELAADENMLARFHREARIGMRMRHPNVARSIELLDSPEQALVMELIEGPSLAGLLAEQGILTPERTAGIAADLGEALRYLDAMGLSRIDIKPSNIVLHRSRGAVIIDLGLVRALEAAGERLTQTGHMIGTPVFMAPEQLLGQEADIRSDLYALGAVLYQCVSGRLPHEGSSFSARLYAVAHEEVSVADLPGSDALREVLRTCLARDPGLRYPTPAAFVAALAMTPESRGAGE
ncbi:serine/threonine-protein kinase [Streptomyces sp. NPDC089919]|uniref:serine/threonine-protein kinase n=1 Tax=Streptomyces sp. NPDC089919 TaxID=3155188 RepID=UPI003442E367